MSRPRTATLRLPASVLLCLGVVAAPCNATAAPPSDDGGFTLSYVAGSRDAAGRFMGGTELRNLAAYEGRLYAGVGYWEDRPGDEGRQGAAILVLDGPAARWRIEHVFDDALPRGRKRDFAISALAGVTFATDGSGAKLAQPVSLLLASSWDLTGATRIFSRDDATGAWTATTLSADKTAPDFLPQIRSLASYDPALPGHIRWSAGPELDISAISTSGFSGLSGRLRVSGFAECNGVLYAAVGQQIYAREDGAAPRWRLVYSNPHPGFSETGLRGLTAIAKPVANPGGGGAGGSKEVLLAAVEGNAARILRVDPDTGAEATELDLRRFLGEAWGGSVGYVIAAYNDMTKLHDWRHGDIVLIGLEAFIPPRSPIAYGHEVVDVGYGRVESGGWYLVRHSDGRYDLRQVALAAPDDRRALVAIRAILPSPFPGDEGALYFAGYDANKAPAHNTAWIARARAKAALRDGP